MRILNEVDQIYIPAESARQTSFAGAILAALDLPADKLRHVPLCMERGANVNQERYRQAAQEIARELERGKNIAWATEGDPLFYSTFLRLWRKLRELVSPTDIEIVPGISSIQAGAARAGVPVALRDEKVAIVPATYGIDRLPELAREFATIFLLKVHLVFDELVTKLEKAGIAKEAWYLENIGTPSERVVTDLASLRGQKLPYFSMVILSGSPFQDR